MLPASLRHDCSSTSNTFVVPIGRRSSMSHSRRPHASGKSSRVRPVKSPSMCISTAATTSCGLPSRAGTSSSRAMLICGTLIMILRLVSCDSAVAAWPAPMFATSRSASIWSSFRSRTSSISPPSPLQEPAGVEDQRRDPVAHDGRPAEHRERALGRVEALHDDLVLPEHAVHHEPRAPLPHLQHDDGRAQRRIAPHAEQPPQVHERHHPVAQHDRFAALHRSEEHTSELQSLAYLVCRLLLEKKKTIISIACIPSGSSQH